LKHVPKIPTCLMPPPPLTQPPYLLLKFLMGLKKNPQTNMFNPNQNIIIITI
jgi:hypothetical protein